MHVCSVNSLTKPLLEVMPELQEIEFSKNLYLSWFRDMKLVHPVAAWCWQLVRVLYKDHPVVKE